MAYILMILLSPLWTPHWSINSITPTIQTESAEVSSLKRAKKLTPLSKNELFDSLKEGYVIVFGKKPSQQRLAMAWAQVSLENGRGSKIYNFNFGNIGASKREPHFFISGHRFRANDSSQEGAILYWKTITKMCSSVFPYFDAGDATGAAYQLRRCGYYRVDKEHYAKGMKKLYWEALKTF